MAKLIKREKSYDLKVNFNDICMREMKYDVTDEDYLYNIDTDEIIQIKDKFIKYFEDGYPEVNHNEIDLNLIENSRLMETLFLYYVRRWIERKHYKFVAIAQSPISGSSKGEFILTYEDNGAIKNIKSDAFDNESLRIFNLVCKLNHTSHLYEFNDFDVEIERKKG